MHLDDKKITWEKNIASFNISIFFQYFRFSGLASIFFHPKKNQVWNAVGTINFGLSKRQRKKSWCYWQWQHTWCCLILFKIYLFSVYVHVCEPMWVHMPQEHATAHGGLKNVLVPKRELQAAVNCLVWVLKTQLRSCAGASSALNHWASLQSLSRWKERCNDLCGLEEFRIL